MSARGKLRPARRVLVQPVGDGLTVLNLDTGQYYELEGTAAAMWDALRDTGSPAATATRLSGHYGADPAIVARDVEAFVTALEKAGLLMHNNFT